MAVISSSDKKREEALEQLRRGCLSSELQCGRDGESNKQPRLYVLDTVPTFHPFQLVILPFTSYG